MPTQHQRQPSLVSLSKWAAALRHRLRQGASRRGPYELLQQLGTGGGTEVYLARHRRRPAEPKVVLKTLGPSATTAWQKSQLQREARLWSLVHDHPNTVRILDSSGCGNRRPYFVMQFSAGATLWETVSRQGPMSIGRSLQVLSQVCAFFQHIHDRGIIHADLAPKNIILVTNGTPAGETIRVLDFGLAREIDRAELEHEATRAIRGTPAFMSPEACLSQGNLTPQSDIYSLGCLGYFLLTGELLFPGATPIEICWKQIHAAPPRLFERTTQTPVELSELLADCVAKSAGDRPPSMRAVALQLQRLSCKIAAHSLPSSGGDQAAD